MFVIVAEGRVLTAEDRWSDFPGIEPKFFKKINEAHAYLNYDLEPVILRRRARIVEYGDACRGLNWYTGRDFARRI